MKTTSSKHRKQRRKSNTGIHEPIRQSNSSPEATPRTTTASVNCYCRGSLNYGTFFGKVTSWRFDDESKADAAARAEQQKRPQQPQPQPQHAPPRKPAKPPRDIERVLWHIKYTDGDAEEINREELDTILVR